MPNTPRLGLPYPAATAPADVPADMQALANALDALVYIIGEVRTFGMLNPPAKWLRCDGGVVLQADYPELYAAIGATWNTGGETGAQFRVPSAAGRAIVGAGLGAGLTVNRAVGSRFGEELHRLLAAESGVPSNGLAATAGAHGHDMQGYMWQPRVGGNIGGAYNTYGSIPDLIAIDGWTQADPDAFGISTVAVGGHTHPLIGKDADAAMPVNQPSVAMLVAIYAGR
jgi:hypothetical protein